MTKNAITDSYLLLPLARTDLLVVVTTSVATVKVAVASAAMAAKILRGAELATKGDGKAGNKIGGKARRHNDNIIDGKAGMAEKDGSPVQGGDDVCMDHAICSTSTTSNSRFDVQRGFCSRSFGRRVSGRSEESRP